MWQLFGRTLVVAGAAVLAASFAGDVHGAGDSLAVFRPVILAGCFVVAVCVWRWRAAQILLVAVVGTSLWHGVGGWLHEGPKQRTDLVVYQKNLLFRPSDRSLFIEDLRRVAADIVTLQEVSQVNRPILDVLSDLYPHQLVCNAHSVGAVAILSRTPLRGEDCGRQTGFARAVTELDGRDVQVVSLHLHWPWPYGQREHALDITGNLAPLANGVTVIGGDFNMVASGRSVAWFEQATCTARVGPHMRTFELFGYPLGIDHVLATGGRGTASVRPLMGSDHYGVVALIEFPNVP